MITRRCIVAFGLCAGLAATPAPVSAHHTFTIYDQSRGLVVTGAVKSWLYTNPHAILTLGVPAKDGTVYILEGLSPNLLKRLGWRNDAIRYGDSVTVTYYAFKNGKPGGQLLRMKTKSGETFDTGTTMFTPKVPVR